LEDIGMRNGSPAQATDERDEYLRQVSLFGDCTDEELRRIAAISRVVEHAAGATLTRVGGPGDSFFLIVDGRVSVETPVGLGDPLEAGDFFGEMSLIDGEPRSATITALTDVRLLVVDRTHFSRLLDDAPDLLRRILVVLSRRVRRLEQVANTMRHRMNQT
jgi:CRP/FNR family transcriptional regulator, cyclic AMP receptor protein